MTGKIAGRRRAAALAVGMTGALAVLTTACGGAGASKDAGLLTYSGADRQQKLAAAATKEGMLSWYTSLAGEVDDRLVKAFEAKYPSIKVSLTRGAENDIATRVEQETQARKYRADVLEVTEPASMKLRQEKITAPFSSPAVASIPAAFKTEADGGKVWDATDRISPISFGYNKTQIPASAVPHDLNGLLNPALDGKLAIESTTTGVRWVGSVLNELGEQRGEAFLKQLSANHVKVQAVSGAALMSLVSQGEVGASPSVFENHAQQQAASHAPVAWVPIGSVVGWSLPSGPGSTVIANVW